jgi:hypothetical protein
LNLAVKERDGVAEGLVGRPQLVDRGHDERLEVGHAHSLRTADVRLLVDLLRLHVEHWLLLQSPSQIAEDPSAIAQLVRQPALVLLQSAYARHRQEPPLRGESSRLAGHHDRSPVATRTRESTSARARPPAT